MSGFTDWSANLKLRDFLKEFRSNPLHASHKWRLSGPNPPTCLLLIFLRKNMRNSAFYWCNSGFDIPAGGGLAWWKQQKNTEVAVSQFRHVWCLLVSRLVSSVVCSNNNDNVGLLWSAFHNFPVSHSMCSMLEELDAASSEPLLLTFTARWDVEIRPEHSEASMCFKASRRMCVILT